MTADSLPRPARQSWKPAEPARRCRLNHHAGRFTVGVIEERFYCGSTRRWPPQYGATMLRANHVRERARIGGTTRNRRQRHVVQGATRDQYRLKTLASRRPSPLQYPSTSEPGHGNPQAVAVGAAVEFNVTLSRMLRLDGIADAPPSPMVEQVG